MNDKEIKISIVVPFYNAEKTLDRCVNSLLNQDIQEIQIVMVDDGSKDGSLDKVKQYALNDERLTVISQINQGQGVARNVGVRNSLGKYILFVDSDDFLEPMILGRMFDLAESNGLDILTAELRHINEAGKEYYFPLKKYDEIETGRECLMRIGICYSLCAHLYNREFLMNNNLYMMEKVRYEDMDYCIRTTWFAERVMDANLVFYNYMVHEGSVSNGKSFDIVEDYYAVTKRVTEFTKEYVDDEAFEAYFRDYLGFLYSHVVNLCATGDFSINKLLSDIEKKRNILYYLLQYF